MFEIKFQTTFLVESPFQFNAIKHKNKCVSLTLSKPKDRDTQSQGGPIHDHIH